jgi:peptide/nickel transport system permease protein
MGRYIIRRLIISIPLLIAISFFVFTLLQFTPGDPVDAYLPPDALISPEQKEAIRSQMGLDRPFLVRYGYWAKEAVQGNLGFRLISKEPVTDAIASRVGATLLLMGTAMSIGILLGIFFWDSRCRSTWPVCLDSISSPSNSTGSLRVDTRPQDNPSRSPTDCTT